MKMCLGMNWLAATALILSAHSAANAQEQITCGNLSKTEVLVDPIGGSFNSTSMIDFTNPITFTVGGAGNSCVLVTFSISGATSVLNPDVGNSFAFRAVLDQSNNNVGNRVQMIQGQRNTQLGDQGVDAHTYNFFFPTVSPGQHTVKMQAAIGIAGDGTPTSPPGGIFEEWIMVVRHR
jgi:hypothetical protein